jgi:uncharacterized protein YegP (UPF0339 family)
VTTYLPHTLRVEIFKGEGKVQPWRFRVRARNREIITVSEGYFSKWNAKRAAKRIFPGADTYEVKA